MKRHGSPEAHPTEGPITPLGYLAELLTSSWKHGGELAVAAGCIVFAVLTTLWVRSLLQLTTFDGPAGLLFVLLPPIGAVLLFEATVAAWRIHRRQGVALASTRALLDLNENDRADLERHLRTRYRRREVGMEARHAARIGRLTDEIALQRKEAEDQSMTRIYVGNLPRELTDAQLRELALPFGRPASVAVVAELAGGASRGFGFIEYESADDAQQAITGLNGKEVGGNLLEVREANVATPCPPADILHSRH